MMCCPTLEPSCRHSSDTPQAPSAPFLLLLDAPSTEPGDKIAFPTGQGASIPLARQANLALR